MGDADVDGLRKLWGRLTRPVEPNHAVEAMFGYSRSAVALLRGALLALSSQAEDLLDAMPALSRSLTIATTDTQIRAVGQVRGPILWSETIAARASSFGDEGLFVCKATNRAYDTPENRILAHALWLVVDAARTVEQQRATGQWNAVIADVKAVGTDALRHLDHRTLDGVSRRRPGGRDLHRTRAGARRRAYQPALDLIERARRPFDLVDLEAVADDESLRWHDLFVRACEAVEDAGETLPGVRADEGLLFTGPVSFRHPAHRRRHHPPSVKVGDVLLRPAEVPDPGEPGAIPVAAGDPVGPLLT